MNGCVYRTTDGKCEFYSDHGKGIVSWCDFDDCEEKKPSNADRIRAMTDEELAEFITPVKCVDCHLLDCGVEEEMLNGKHRTCQERVLDWLKQESEV